MTDWFRQWHGAPTDSKWRTVARRASVRPGDVFAVVSWLWDRASQSSDRGSIAGYDVEIIADGFGYEVEEVERIIAALVDKNVLADGRIVAWDKYQPKREDNTSTERVRAFRDKKRDNHAPAAKSAVETQGNAPQLDETPEQKQSRAEADTEKIAADLSAGERASFAEIEHALRKAAGHENSTWPGLSDLSPIIGAIEGGASLEDDVLPALRSRPFPKARSWGYYLPQIQDFRARRLGAALSTAAIVPLATGPPRAGASRPDPKMAATRRLMQEYPGE